MSYYSILGISEKASDAEIKKAFFRLVRTHPPEKEPEKYKELRAAYETLGSEQTRRQYDALLKHGGEISDLHKQVEAAVEREDWPACSRLLKKILVLNPQEHGARFELAFSLRRQGDDSAAVEQLVQLVKLAPDVAGYWSALGEVLRQQADTDEGDEGSRATLRNRARKAFLQAVDVEKVNAEAYVGLARLYADEGQLKSAVSLLEKAITADGKVDMQDLDTFLYLCVLHSRQDNWAALENAVDRLVFAVPDDPDAKGYVAARFVQLASFAAQGHAYKMAGSFIKISERFAPADSDLKKFAKAVGVMHGALEEWKRLQDDISIVPPLRGLIAVVLMQETDEGGSEAQRADHFNGAIEALGTYPTSAVLSSLRRLKSSYPNCFALRAEWFNDILGKLASAPSHQESSPSGGSSGCLVFLCAALAATGVLWHVLTRSAV